jgi:hypothetical protein
VLKWIADNYTWVFSGAGVTAFVLLIGLFRWKKRNRQNGKSSLKVSNVGSTLMASPMAGRDVIQTVYIGGSVSTDSSRDADFSEIPTANDIRIQINALPIYQQPTARESYAGLKVKWPATLTNLHIVPSSGLAGVSMRYGDEDWGATLYAELDLRRYPRLKTIYGGEPVVVRGTIAEVQSGIIWMNVDQLEFRTK